MPWAAAALPVIATVASIGGTALSAFSSLKQGSTQAAALQSQAQAARYNQQVAEQNALMVEQSGQYQEQLQHEKNVKLLASQKAGYAKAGVTMSGTPLDVMAGTASDQEQDIIAQRYNTEIQAWRYRSQGAQYGFQASQDVSMAGAATTAGWLGAGTTLLTGAGRAIAPYLQGSSAKIPTYTGYGSELQ